MRYHASVYTTMAELEVYAGRWNEIVDSSNEGNVFLTWEWLEAWCRYVGVDVPLFIIAVFDDKKELQAALPLYQSSLILLNYIPYKCLRLIGDCHSGGEYPDVLVAADVDAASVLEAIRICLHQHHTMWDCIYFPYVAGWTKAFTRLQAAIKGDSAFARRREIVFSSIALPDSMEEYNGCLTNSLYSTIQRQKKKLEKSGTVTFEVCDTDEQLPFYMQKLFTLHKKRWEAVNQEGSFVRRPLMKNFYTGFSSKALRKEWLKIFSLRLDDEILAVQIGFLFNGVFYQIQEGFDPQGSGGLGNILRYLVINWCIAHGVKEYDYLGGDDEHKFKWGARQRMGYQYFTGRKAIRNIFLAPFTLWPSGRYIKEGRPASLGRSHD